MASFAASGHTTSGIGRRRCKDMIRDPFLIIPSDSAMRTEPSDATGVIILRSLVARGYAEREFEVGCARSAGAIEHTVPNSFWTVVWVVGSLHVVDVQVALFLLVGPHIWLHNIATSLVLRSILHCGCVCDGFWIPSVN